MKLLPAIHCALRMEKTLSVFIEFHSAGPKPGCLNVGA